jgi:iron complex transport system permease protein
VTIFSSIPLTMRESDAGSRFDRLLPAAILLGVMFMIAVDTLARSAARSEILLSVQIAMIGGPVFVRLLARHRRTAAMTLLAANAR